MRLDHFITKSRIIDIKSSHFEDALKELLRVCNFHREKRLHTDELIQDLIERERGMTTYLGYNVSLPHLKIPLNQPYIFAVGRCPQGLEFGGMEEYRNVRFIFLLLASEKEKTYLTVLSSLARIFQNKTIIQEFLDTPALPLFRDKVIRSIRGLSLASGQKTNKFNRLILREASKIAKGASCNRILVFADTFTEGLDLSYLSNFKTILVTQSSAEISQDRIAADSIITVRSFSKNRLAQMRSAILIGLSRGILSFNDKLCCLAGIPNSNQYDTVVVVDVSKEFQTVFNHPSDMLPKDVKPEVVERVLAIATELAVEGREGKPVGCLFVVGDIKKIKPFIKPLVLNPFFGYKDEDRNILNPFMDETVKEFSTIDGAFIIRGDGVLESAGSLIYAPEFVQELPGGLGSRHNAAAAISTATNCFCIAVSTSRQVTIFRGGQMFPVM